MSSPFIVDTHVHTGAPNVFYSPEIDARRLLARMDELAIRFSVNLGSARNLLQASAGEMEKAQAEFEESAGRIFYCGYFDARRASEDLALLEKASRASAFKGIKIHPSFSKVPADDPRFDGVWKFAAERGLPILSHTWSASSYNPVQVLSTPERFVPCVEKYPSVKFVLGHSGGRGEGRLQAIRMARQYPGVFMDVSGDIMDRHFLEQMVREGVGHKVLFGSDYPWLDQRAHLCCVYLAGIPAEAKRMILRDTGLAVFGLPAE
jgi:uncharacterized protein